MQPRRRNGGTVSIQSVWILETILVISFNLYL